MKKQDFEKLIKFGYITNVVARGLLHNEEELSKLTLNDLYKKGYVTVAGLDGLFGDEESTKAPIVETTEEPVETTKAPVKNVKETTKAPIVETTEEPEVKDIVVDEGDDE